MGIWSAPNLHVYALMKWKEKRPRTGTLGVNRTGMRLRLCPPPRGVNLVCGPRMGPRGDNGHLRTMDIDRDENSYDFDGLVRVNV